MKIPVLQKQVNPTSRSMNENDSIDGEFMGKHATPVSVQKMLEPVVPEGAEQDFNHNLTALCQAVNAQL